MTQAVIYGMRYEKICQIKLKYHKEEVSCTFVKNHKSIMSEQFQTTKESKFYNKMKGHPSMIFHFNWHYLILFVFLPFAWYKTYVYSPYVTRIFNQLHFFIIFFCLFTYDMTVALRSQSSTIRLLSVMFHFLFASTNNKKKIIIIPILTLPMMWTSSYAMQSRKR